MLFNSATFIFIFLPIVLLFYFIWNNRTYRNLVLCISSLIFYMWGEPKYIFLMLFVIIINYIIGFCLEKTKYKKIVLILTIVINISILIYFKYLNLIGDVFKLLFNYKLNLPNVILPLSISFYTFQIISYIVDIYNGRIKAEKSLLKFTTYITLFPQLIAGPIVRYKDIEKQIDYRHENISDIIKGIQKFIIGLSKKVILANNLSLIVDSIFEIPLNSLSTIPLWIGSFAFYLEIYYDFSGYSDMAIGLARIFGFKLPENFNYPYMATSIADYWRRWHISLSTWFRDYIYIPLGGNRVKTGRWIINILTVWILTGLWHGADFNYILWGLYYAIILLVEKILDKHILKNIPDIIKGLTTMFLVIIGFVIFRNHNISDIIFIIYRMLIYTPGQFTIDSYNLAKSIWYIIPASVFIFPFAYKLFSKFINKNLGCRAIGYSIYVILFVISISMMITDSYNPFIYFRF